MNKETLDFCKAHGSKALELYWYLKGVSNDLASKTRRVSDELDVPACFGKRGLYE